jgi:hypothetical protein
MELHEIKMLLHNKEMFSKLEKPPIKWEKNLYQLYIRQGTDNQNLQGT